MKTYGYARVSTTDQDLDVQIAALKAAGCDIILEEKASGKDREGRPKLALLLEVLGAGDQVIVCKLDRLGRETIDLLEIAEEIGAKGAGFKSLAEPWADTTTPEKKLIYTIFAGFAEWERSRIRERQREGIAANRNALREDGSGLKKYAGGKTRFDPAQIRKMRHEDGIMPAAIAASLGCTVKTVERALSSKEATNGHAS